MSPDERWFPSHLKDMGRSECLELAQVARELGINEGTLGNGCAQARGAAGEDNGELSETERAELARLRKEIVELRMQHDVLKRSVALWVDEAMGR
jgi:transposase